MDRKVIRLTGNGSALRLVRSSHAPPRGSSSSLGFHRYLARPQAVALVGELEDDAVVHEPIDHGAGGIGIGEDLRPIGEREVCRETDARTFVPARNDLEEQIGGPRRAPKIAHLGALQNRTLPGGQSKIAHLM